jgi:hypothetical protein
MPFSFDRHQHQDGKKQVEGRYCLTAFGETDAEASRQVQPGAVADSAANVFGIDPSAVDLIVGACATAEKGRRCKYARRCRPGGREKTEI